MWFPLLTHIFMISFMIQDHKEPGKINMLPMGLLEPKMNDRALMSRAHLAYQPAESSENVPFLSTPATELKEKEHMDNTLGQNDYKYEVVSVPSSTSRPVYSNAVEIGHDETVPTTSSKSLNHKNVITIQGLKMVISIIKHPMFKMLKIQTPVQRTAQLTNRDRECRLSKAQGDGYLLDTSPRHSYENDSAEKELKKSAGSKSDFVIVCGMMVLMISSTLFLFISNMFLIYQLGKRERIYNNQKVELIKKKERQDNSSQTAQATTRTIITQTCPPPTPPPIPPRNPARIPPRIKTPPLITPKAPFRAQVDEGQLERLLKPIKMPVFKPAPNITMEELMAKLPPLPPPVIYPTLKRVPQLYALCTTV